MSGAQRYTLEVCSRALPGREDDYASWYLNTHLGDVVAQDGFLSGRLTRRLDAQGKDTGEFVAHYEVETDNPAGLLQSLFAASATMQLTDSIDMNATRFHFLQSA